jgi:hypothetical protein
MVPGRPTRMAQVLAKRSTRMWKGAGCRSGVLHGSVRAMMTELITSGALAEIEKAAAKYGLRLRHSTKTYANGHPKYHFDHPEQKIWIFVIDSEWRKHRIRFQRRFIEKLRRNGLLADEETGAGENCSVESKDFDSALRLCTAALTRPNTD